MKLAIFGGFWQTRG